MKTYLKPLKRDQRKSFTQENCRSSKVMNESAPQNPQLFQLKLLSTKLTFLIKKITGEFNKLFTKHWN